MATNNKKRLESAERNAKFYDDQIEEIITIPCVCGNCEFYAPDGQTCNKNSPKPIILNCEREEPLSYYAVFPRINPSSDWCGEFKLDHEVYKNAPRLNIDGITYVGDASRS